MLIAEFLQLQIHFILNGIDVTSIRIDENKMRTHFLQCLEQGRFEPFPEKQTDYDTFFSLENIISVEILCRYRMPWVWYHIKNAALNMADCDTCHQWYYRKCENLPSEVFDENKSVE